MARSACFAIADLGESAHTPPPISSIIVTQTTVESGVISINAVKIEAPSTAIPPDILANMGAVLDLSKLQKFTGVA